MGTMMAAMPTHERPRERLLTHGIEALTERELLALVLRNGTQGMNALGLAAELLAEYGSLAALTSAHPEELAARKGVGEAKAAAVVAAFRLGRQADADERPDALRRPADVARIAMQSLRGLRREGGRPRLMVQTASAEWYRSQKDRSTDHLSRFGRS